MTQVEVERLLYGVAAQLAAQPPVDGPRRVVQLVDQAGELTGSPLPPVSPLGAAMLALAAERVGWRTRTDGAS